MDSTIRDLAEKIMARYRSTPPDARLLVGIAGIPGSGKSTLAYPLTDRLNALLDASSAAGPAICVGLDGWHHTRQALEGFPDPVLARARRGAAFTFDAPSYAAFVRSLRLSPPPATIAFPTFSHELKDPQPAPEPITPSYRIVVIEGLYAFVDDPTEHAWAQAACALDLRIWVDVDEEVARGRIAARNFASGIESTMEATLKRVEANDLPNGRWIREHLISPTDTVQSVEDGTFAPPS